MSTTTSRMVRRTAAVIALAGLGSLTLGVSPAAADTTDPQTVAVDLGDLDNAGSGVFDQFDPSLGELTAVTITAEVSMDFDVCVTNLSEVATTAPSGTATGEAVLTFAGGVVANATGAMAVPELDLAASDGGDDCDTFVDSGSAPGSADSQLTSQSGVVETFSETVTDPSQLAPYVGTGTVGFDWSPASASNVSQPSEWTIAFLARGAGEATVVYEYTPTDVSGTGSQSPTEASQAPIESSQSPTEDSQQSPGMLPDAGGPDGWLVALAGLLLMAGGSLIVLRRAGRDLS